MQQHCILELDGQPAGRLFGFQGGRPETETVQEKFGPDVLIHKHIAAVRYGDITLVCGAGTSRRFYDWVAASFSRSYQRKNGALVKLDFQQVEVARIDFFDALVTEVVLPELDRAEKKAAAILVKIAPERTTLTRGGKHAHVGAFVSPLAKPWFVKDFRLRISGLENECNHVTHVHSLSLTQKVTEVPVGEFRAPYREPTQVESPNLVIGIPEVHASGFFKWFEDFVVRGKSAPSNEKHGTLEYLAPGSSQTYFRFDLRGLGIFKIAPNPARPGIRHVKIEMYCEEMPFSYGSAACGG